MDRPLTWPCAYRLCSLKQNCLSLPVLPAWRNTPRKHWYLMEQKLLHTKLTSNEEMEEYLSEQQDEMEVEEIRAEGMEIIDGEAIDGMGDTNTPSTIAIQKTIDERKNEVFWYSDKNTQKVKLAIDNRRLLKWLRSNGHTLLRDGKPKTSGFATKLARSSRW